MRLRYLVVFAALACNAYAQDPLAEMRLRLERQRLDNERQRTESVSKLRQAIVGLRDARQKSCDFKAGRGCHLAELSSIELTLLNIEDSYRLTESRSQNEAKNANYKKIQEAANDLRDKVSELADLIERSER